MRKNKEWINCTWNFRKQRRVCCGKSKRSIIKTRFILLWNAEIYSAIGASMASGKCAIIVTMRRWRPWWFAVSFCVIVGQHSKMEMTMLLNGAIVSYNPRQSTINSIGDTISAGPRKYRISRKRSQTFPDLHYNLFLRYSKSTSINIFGNKVAALLYYINIY